MNKAGKKTSFAKEKDKTKQEDEPLNSEGVHEILRAYKDARSTCLNLKNSPSLVKMFTPEAIMLLEMVGDGRLKYITDETLLRKYDEVVVKRREDYGSECEPYKTRENLALAGLLGARVHQRVQRIEDVDDGRFGGCCCGDAG